MSDSSDQSDHSAHPYSSDSFAILRFLFYNLPHLASFDTCQKHFRHVSKTFLTRVGRFFDTCQKVLKTINRNIISNLSYIDEHLLGTYFIVPFSRCYLFSFLFLSAIRKLIQYFAEGTSVRQSKEKQAFILYFPHLIVPLQAIITF